MTLFSLYFKRIKRFLPMRVASTQISELLEGTSHPDCVKIARKINNNHYKNIIFWMIGKFIGIKFLANIRKFNFHGEEQLIKLYKNKQPIIITFGHMGPIFSTITGLYRLGIPFLVLMRNPEKYKFPKEIIPINVFGDLEQNISALKNAHKWLKNGGVVLAAFDGIQGSTLTQVPFMGRQIYLRKGIPTLQRLTNAVVIPVSVASSKRNIIDLVIHDPLPVSFSDVDDIESYELELLSQAAQWLEKAITAHPDQLRSPQVHDYLSLPKIN